MSETTTVNREENEKPKLLTAYDTWGLIVAAIVVPTAYSPSLLPRTWIIQGLVAGVVAVAGYMLGIGLHMLWTAIMSRWGKQISELLFGVAAKAPNWTRHHQAAAWTQAGAMLLLVVVVALSVLGSVGQQREQARELDMAPPGPWHFLGTIPVTLLVWLGLVMAFRVMNLWAYQITELLEHTPLSSGTKSVVSWVSVILALVLIAGNVVPYVGVTLAERYFVERNDSYRQDIWPPEVSERAAGPGSAISWDGLGYEGSRFVADGRTAAQLEEVTGRPATEPIRLYAGLGNGDTMEERVDLIVDELVRTDAASREAVLIMPVTGTGWANPVAAQAFELLYDGDTAIASAQYGVLPSALSVVLDRNVAEGPSRELVTAISQWWMEIPEDERPELYIYGESLGTQGAESGLMSMWPAGVLPDGMLLIGPPQGNEVRRWFIEERVDGSPEYRPEQPEASGIRFAIDADDIMVRAEDPQWGTEFRVMYVQHPTDPVVWWSPALLYSTPDWLEEPVAPGRMDNLSWLPWVTFWQVTADLSGAAAVPEGYGHNYADAMVEAWVAVTADPRTSPEEIDSLNDEFWALMEQQGPEKGHVEELNPADGSEMQVNR